MKVPIGKPSVTNVMWRSDDRAKGARIIALSARGHFLRKLEFLCLYGSLALIMTLLNGNLLEIQSG